MLWSIDDILAFCLATASAQYGSALFLKSQGVRDLSGTQMLDDEEEALAAADVEAQMAAEEAARAVRRSQPQPDGGVSDNVARAQRRAEEATKRANALRLIIEGPHPVMVRLFIG